MTNFKFLIHILYGCSSVIQTVWQVHWGKLWYVKTLVQKKWQDSGPSPLLVRFFLRETQYGECSQEPTRSLKLPQCHRDKMLLKTDTGSFQPDSLWHSITVVVELPFIPRACKSKCENFPRIKNTTLQDSPWPDPPPRVDQVIRGAQGNKIQTQFPQHVLHPMATIPFYYVLYSSVRLSISCSVSWLSAQCDRDAITFEAASFIDLMIIASSVLKVIKVCTKSDHNLNQKWPNSSLLYIYSSLICTVLTLSCRSRDTFTSIYRKTTSVYKHDTNQGTSTAGARSRRVPINS